MTLNRTDSIETVLPMVEEAMNSGEVCHIHNIDYLGYIHTAALALLATSCRLLDSATGCIVEAKPGFCLIGIEESGVTRRLTM